VIFTEVLTISPSETDPSIILLYSPSPIPGILSTGIIFLFAYTCTQYLHHIHPPMPFSHLLSPPTGTNPQAGPVLPSCSPCL
jgi:hypothetical protein